MQITKHLLTPGSAHGRTGQALTPKGVCVHYVGNPGSTAEANRKWFENGAGGAHTSAHYIIGLGGEILLLIPETERAQHAGKSYGAAWDATAKQNNASYIGIECCHPDAAGKFNDKTYASLIALCADICKRYDFDPLKHVVRHYDIAGKSCPLYYKNNPAEWARLQADVQRERGLRGGAVRVSLDGTVYQPTAENIGGSWYIPLPELGGVKVKLGDALTQAGYTVSWHAETATVIGVSAGNTR